MRLGFLVITDHGRCSGHFINDVGATLEAAARWIVAYQMRVLPQDTRLIQVVLYDGGTGYGRVIYCYIP